MSIISPHIGAFGVIGIGGIVAFGIGSIMLFPTGVPGFGAETMDLRTNVRLDQPLPSSHEGFRALCQDSRGLHPSRNDPQHAPALDQIKSLPLNQNFLDRLLGLSA